ncbi:terpenoid cyclases/protein prenyltransferase alpha-alpha toroid [Melampsora americana]|nr:terpenoid cyclases/protein prenyltransferase alpha-alpha toroid [Melampsora americana]
MEHSNPTQDFHFSIKAHIRYSLRCLRLLPSPYESDDNNRLTFGFFSIGSLSLLGSIDRLDQEEKDDYIQWIYERWDSESGGFTGHPNVDLRIHSNPEESLNQPHITHTYAAILLLALLSTPQSEDHKPINPYTALEVPKLLKFVVGCQRSNGSFGPFPSSTEQDVRFVYCATAILSILNQDPRKVIDVQSTRYDGGYGQAPFLESQGGTTYCALAALNLLDRLDDSLSSEEALETARWLVHRQNEFHDLPDEESDEGSNSLQDEIKPTKDVKVPEASGVSSDSLPQNHEPLVAGFQGRPGKLLDACYSFWCTAALSIIREHHSLKDDQSGSEALFHDPEANIRFLMLCQSKQWGGIGRFPEDHPDVYHNYLALGSISLSYALINNQENPLVAHHPALNVPIKTVKWMKECFR